LDRVGLGQQGPFLSVITAAAVLTFLPEIGTMERKQVASLAGLVPFTRQSGQW
jgi:transposase